MLALLLNIWTTFLNTISNVLINVSVLPLPIYFSEFVGQLFGVLEYFKEFPILRVLWPWILIFITIVNVSIVWNILIKILTVIPLFSGLNNFRILKPKKYDERE